MLLRVTMVLGGVVASPSKHLNTWDRLTSLHHVAYSHPAICLDFPPTLASPPPQCHSAYTGSGKNIQNSDAITDPSCSARCENLTINQWDDISVSLLSLSLSYAKHSCYCTNKVQAFATIYSSSRPALVVSFTPSRLLSTA
jgi:endogenous inhibitor of DNA gyrase (YacG/DUF329 family)